MHLHRLLARWPPWAVSTPLDPRSHDHFQLPGAPLNGACDGSWESDARTGYAPASMLVRVAIAWHLEPEATARPLRPPASSGAPASPLAWSSPDPGNDPASSRRRSPAAQPNECWQSGHRPLARPTGTDRRDPQLAPAVHSATSSAAPGMPRSPGDTVVKEFPAACHERGTLTSSTLTDSGRIFAARFWRRAATPSSTYSIHSWASSGSPAAPDTHRPRQNYRGGFTQPSR